MRKRSHRGAPRDGRDIGGEFHDSLIALGGRPCERGVEHGLQSCGKGEVGPRRGELRRLVGQALDHRLLHRRRLEWQSSGQRPKEHERQRVQIAPAVERVARQLFGAHELGCSDDQAGLGDLLAGLIATHGFCDPEVYDLHRVAAAFASGQHDVVGL